MRVLVTATAAASVLAIGLRMEPAQSLPLGGKIAGPDAAVQHVQQQEKGMTGPGQGGQRPGMGSPGQSPGQGGPKMGGPGGGGGQMKGQGGMQYRSGKGMREGGAQLRSERSRRFDRDRDRDRGRGGFHFGFGPGGPSFGYGPRRGGCGWLRQRALETDSPYWWRRYRACRG
jgi:hypothetical protein